MNVIRFVFHCVPWNLNGKFLFQAKVAIISKTNAFQFLKLHFLDSRKTNQTESIISVNTSSNEIGATRITIFEIKKKNDVIVIKRKLKYG